MQCGQQQQTGFEEMRVCCNEYQGIFFEELEAEMKDLQCMYNARRREVVQTKEGSVSEEKDELKDE